MGSSEVTLKSQNSSCLPYFFIFLSQHQTQCPDALGPQWKIVELNCVLFLQSGWQLRRAQGIFSRWCTMSCLVIQSCLTLCDPMNPSPPLSMGILQARILEWVAMPSSKGSSQPRDQTQIFPIAGVFFTIWATREDRNVLKLQHSDVCAPLQKLLQVIDLYTENLWVWGHVSII